MVLGYKGDRSQKRTLEELVTLVVPRIVKLRYLLLGLVTLYNLELRPMPSRKVLIHIDKGVLSVYYRLVLSV